MNKHPCPRLPRRVLLLGVAWLTLVWGVALVAARSTPWLTGPTGWPPNSGRPRGAALARWDSGWYVAIAESGYEARRRVLGQETNHAFFPLYPALMRGVSKATGLDVARAGALVSALALLGALVLLAAWTRRRFGEERVWPALVAFLVFPTSFFFAAVYTESLLVLLALAAILALETDRDAPGDGRGPPHGAHARSPASSSLPRSSSSRGGEVASSADPSPRRSFGPSPQARLRSAGFGLFCLYFRAALRRPVPLRDGRSTTGRARPRPSSTGRASSCARSRAISRRATSSRRVPVRTMEGVFLLLFLLPRVSARRHGDSGPKRSTCS